MKSINHTKALNVFIIMTSFLLSTSKMQSLNFNLALDQIGMITSSYFDQQKVDNPKNRMEPTKIYDLQEISSSPGYGWEITNCL